MRVAEACARVMITALIVLLLVLLFALLPDGSREREVSREVTSCCVCLEPITKSGVSAGECGHQYHVECMTDMFAAHSHNDMQFPPRCCEKPISLSVLQDHISDHLFRQYEARIREVNTVNRLYCRVPDS